MPVAATKAPRVHITNDIPTLPDELRMILGVAKTLGYNTVSVGAHQSPKARSAPSSDHPVKDEGCSAEQPWKNKWSLTPPRCQLNNLPSWRLLSGTSSVNDNLEPDSAGRNRAARVSRSLANSDPLLRTILDVLLMRGRGPRLRVRMEEGLCL